jgi:cytoplasmic iron level regulating protein YaaA (DUF328/UPF0246 family)
MLILLSPAKKQDFETKYPHLDATKPLAHKESAILVEELKKLKKAQISKLMSVSDKIADLNYQRFQTFDPTKYNRSNAKQAVFAFMGDAYRSLDAASLSEKQIDFLQDHLVILSGLYGYLRPLDLIQPYRLEMKTQLKNPRGKDLYKFWDDLITKGLAKLQKDQKNKTIINLASGEYFKAVSQACDPNQIINIIFKEKKGNAYKVIGINAKRARGAMTRYIAENRITNPNKLVDFNLDGYKFNKSMSSDTDYIFVR